MKILKSNKNVYLYLIIIYLCSVNATSNQNILNDELNGIDFVRVLEISQKIEKKTPRGTRYEYTGNFSD